jgi:hypothetical protein
VFDRCLVVVGRRGVWLIPDRSEGNSAARLVLAVVAVLMVVLWFVLAVFTSAGRVGGSRMLADVACGGLYEAAEGYR